VYRPNGTGAAIPAALCGVERVEVLRGPQGTLCSRITTGGAISIVSRLPTGKPQAQVQAGIAD